MNFESINRKENDQKIETRNKMILGICLILFYFIASFSQLIPLSLFNIDYTKLPLWIKVIYLLTYQFLEIGVIIFLLRKTLKKDVIDLKQHHKEYFAKYFKYWFLLLILMMISNLFITIFTPNEIAGNEQSVRESFQIAPIYIFISSVFIAPFLEEFVFRQGIRNICSNNICFILFSGLLFGSMHVITSLTNYWELLYIIPYSIPGFIFAYLLLKTDNVLVPASMHFIHNGILMSLQMLLLLLA